MSNVKNKKSINIPSKISNLRIRHLKAFEILEQTEDWSIMRKIEFIKAYCIDNINVENMRDVDVSSITKVFNKIMSIISKYKPKELPFILELDGKEFELQDDFSKLPVGWFIDASSVDFKERPELLPAFCYIEKGMSYAEKDKHENILNPLKNRAELFKEHLPLDLFLNLSSFFLLKQKIYNEYYMAIQNQKKDNPKVPFSIGKT